MSAGFNPGAGRSAEALPDREVYQIGRPDLSRGAPGRLEPTQGVPGQLEHSLAGRLTKEVVQIYLGVPRVGWSPPRGAPGRPGTFPGRSSLIISGRFSVSDSLSGPSMIFYSGSSPPPDLETSGLRT